jgi:hypothetical protein
MAGVARWCGDSRGLGVAGVSTAPVEITITADLTEFVSAMQRAAAAITEAANRSARAMNGFAVAFRSAEDVNTRRTHMHTAYRAKTRRRNRRTK